MRVYARKLFPHDITHEVSVRTDIVQDFFEGKSNGLKFIGKRSGLVGEVTINSVTDPRFGGAIKSILIEEGRVEVNDIVLMYKLQNDTYVLEVIKNDDERYLDLFVLFRGKERHIFLETYDELKLAGLFN